jgi:hypothetical protein
VKRVCRQLAFVDLLLLAVLAACGGGGNPSSPPPPPPPALAIPAQTFPQGLVGKAYSGKLRATGGVAPYRWSTQLLGIGGLTLATDGTISGTPTVPGTFIPNFTVTDSMGASVTAGVEIDIVATLTFATSSALPDQNLALPVYTYISANGGEQPYTYSLLLGSTMPPGLTFTNTGGIGLIQGTPTTPGTYSFTVQVTDSFSPPQNISQTFTINVLNNLVLPHTSLPDAVLSIPYQEQIQPAGGTPPYKFVLGQYSSMPPGLKLDSSTGIVTGTPTATTNDVLLVNITDSASPPAQINPLITLNVQPPLSIQTSTLPDSARGLNYYGTLNIIGGRAPYLEQVISGSLPDGVTINPSPYASMFNVTGVPTKDGLFSFTLQVSDSYETPNTTEEGYQVRISDPMNMTGPPMAQILYNQNYSASFPVTGGFPPYTWTMNPVPPGFTFDSSTGTLSGTPAGTTTFTSSLINAQDSSHPPLHANYLVFQLYVYEKLQILTRALPPFAAGSATWLGLQAGGGAGPYTWSASSGSLPSGMTLNSSGLLRGTPSTAGTYPVTISLSDGNTGSLNQTASAALTVTVKDRSQLLRNDTLAQATPLSTISLLASISPFSDPLTTGPDIDVYSASASPGSQVWLYIDANNDFLQPPLPNSMLPVLEIVDTNGTRYQTCSQPNSWLTNGPFTFPCVNGLDGQFYQSAYFGIQLPASGTTPVTFYVRVSDARGDARPDFIYTLTVLGAN